MSKTAAAYIRVSSERQDEYSPDSQKKLIREYAKKNNIEVPKEINIDEFNEKVRTVLGTVTDDSVDESAKNKAMRTIISKIIYNKTNNRLDFFFHDK